MMNSNEICRAAPLVGGAPPTNGDRVRTMSDEGLAALILNGISSDPCDYCEHNNFHCDGTPCNGKADAETIIDWLRRPAEEVRANDYFT